MKIVMMMNLKGGVAKTTNCVAIAERFAIDGYRVLVIDADHQCTATELLLGEDRFVRLDSGRRTLNDLLNAMMRESFDPRRVDYYISEKASNIGEGLEYLDIIPGSYRLDEYSTNRDNARDRYHDPGRFKNMIDRRRDLVFRHLDRTYDYVFVDCPPSLALHIQYLLGSADGYIIPCVPDRLSVRGAKFLMKRLADHGFSRPRAYGLLWTLYRKSVRMHREYLGREHDMGSLPRAFKNFVPNAADIPHSTDPEHNHSTFGYKYGQHAKDITKLCDEIRKEINRY